MGSNSRKPPSVRRLRSSLSSRIHDVYYCSTSMQQMVVFTWKRNILSWRRWYPTRETTKNDQGALGIERHLSGWIREKAINRSLQQPLFERGECSIFLQGCIATWKMTRILQEYLHHGNHASSNVISLPPPRCYPPWPFSIIQTIDWWIDATSFPQLQLPSISYSIKAAFDEGLLRLI